MGAKKPDTFVNQITGDYFEYYQSIQERPAHRRSPFGKRWMKMAFEAHAALAKMEGVFTNDFRVFHLIMPTIHDGNMVYINQALMAKELGMPASVVSRSIRKLITKGVLERMNTASGRTYRLNPHFAWYGPDNGAHTQSVRDWDKCRSIQ